MFRHSAFLLMMVCFSIAFIASCGSDNKQKGDTGMSEQEQTMTNQQNMSQKQVFEATLQGSNEVPPVETDATGSVTVTLSGDSIHVQGQFSDLSSEYVASHIHKAPKGKNGGVVQPLGPELGSDKRSGTFDATYAISQDLIDALKSDSLYINVHSANHKSGEIRGQLTETGM